MKLWQKKSIYLDYAGGADNPSAIHSVGVKSHKKVEKSRKKIADLLNAHADEIIFTGSGTESIALAIFGIVYAKQKYENFSALPSHIVTTNIEHPAVLENCKMLEEKGIAEVTYVPVEANGIVDPKKIRDAIKENTVLVSVCYANNEIGTIQPIQEIAKEIRHYKKINKTDFPLFHTDACQAMNYLETNNVEKLGVDLLSFNSSKIYGPKGVGVLYKKRGVEPAPLYGGGGQEFGLRSGTENVLGIVGVAKALERVCKIKDKESKRLVKLRDYTIDKLLKLSNSKYQIKLNGDKINRLPNNINISVSGISSELLVIELDAKGFCISEKSACGSREEESSHVIKALREAEGKSTTRENDSIRISLGQKTKKRHMVKFIQAFSQILEKYQKFK